MKISPSLAGKIVDSLKMTLKQEINFINVAGLVIASTDKERIGVIHEGALTVVKTKEPLLVEYDNQFKETKKGINMPIYFENEMIGIIGLTGEKEVEKYAQILKAMTEILIKEAYLNDLVFQQRERHRLIIESLLLNKTDSSKESLFGVDFSTPYRIAVSSPKSTKEDFSQLYPLLESCLSSNKQIFFTIAPSLIILLIPQIDLDPLLETIHQEAFKRHKINLNFGVGLLSHTKKELKNSFETAKQALAWIQTQTQSSKVAYFERLDLGILLSNIPSENKEFFMRNVLGSIPEQELNYFNTVLETFSKHNGSIQKSANELFIHKNTFQYQLNKIKKQTGYDPRNYHDFTILYLALLLYKK